MKKTFSALFLLIFCIFSAPATEPTLIGTAEMPSMTGFLNSTAPFMEKLSPGLSAKLLLGMTALAFAPDLKDVDITQPIALYIYAMPSVKTPEPATVIVVAKKADQIPAQMQITGQQLYTKTFGNKVMLSESKNILDAISTLPEPMKIEDNQVKVFVRPADFIKNFPEDFQEFRREIVKQIASSGKRRLDVNGIKVLNLKLAYIEKAIEQMDSISLTISPDKEIINIDLAIKAKKDSELDQFITAQEKLTVLDPGYPPENKLISASGYVKMTEPFRKTLSDMAEGIAVEEADDESQMKYVSTLQLLLKTFQGTFSFYMDNLPSQNNKRFTLTTLEMENEKAAAAILKSLSETSKKIDDKTYSMTSIFIGPQTESKLIAFVDGKNIKILSGPLSDKEASEQFAVRYPLIPTESIVSCRALIGKDNPSKAKIDFKESNLLLSLALTPETLKPVLPDNPLLNPQPQQQKPGQKKKKQRIHIKPSDFMKTK